MGFPTSTCRRFDGLHHRPMPKFRRREEPDPRLWAMGRRLAAEGQGQDDLLAHINRREAELLQEFGGAGTRNARTGLLQFDDTQMQDEAPEDAETALAVSPTIPAMVEAAWAAGARALEQIVPVWTFQPWRESMGRAIDELTSGPRRDVPRYVGDFIDNPALTLRRAAPTLAAIVPGVGKLPNAVYLGARALGIPPKKGDISGEHFYPDDRKIPEPPTQDWLYHHTFDKFADEIAKHGLSGESNAAEALLRRLLRKDPRHGSYATTEGDLAPDQAQIDLALPPNGLRNKVVKIDLAAMRKDGLPIPPAKRVGRDFNMPGGGTEVYFRTGVDPKYLPEELARAISRKD